MKTDKSPSWRAKQVSDSDLRALGSAMKRLGVDDKAEGHRIAEAGGVDEFLAKREALRAKVGQTTTLTAHKPLSH